MVWEQLQPKVKSAVLSKTFGGKKINKKKKMDSRRTFYYLLFSYSNLTAIAKLASLKVLCLEQIVRFF